jgi:hypothetical protein
MRSRAGRFWTGFGWGVVATIGMSVLMLLGRATGLTPMPKPVPVALVARILGGGPKPLLMTLGALSHLAYGGFWGGVLASATRRIDLAKGLGLGIALWLLMQLVALPFLGWGAFGLALTPKIAVATLVLHLVYGGLLGVLADRPKVPATAGA